MEHRLVIMLMLDLFSKHKAIIYIKAKNKNAISVSTVKKQKFAKEKNEIGYLTAMVTTHSDPVNL